MREWCMWGHGHAVHALAETPTLASWCLHCIPKSDAALRPEHRPRWCWL